MSSIALAVVGSSSISSTRIAFLPQLILHHLSRQMVKELPTFGRKQIAGATADEFDKMSDRVREVTAIASSNGCVPWRERSLPWLGAKSIYGIGPRRSREDVMRLSSVSVVVLVLFASPANSQDRPSSVDRGAAIRGAGLKKASGQGRNCDPRKAESTRQVRSNRSAI
jgi:hypothetical protein